MVEKNLIVDAYAISYKGLFDLKGLLDTINSISAKRGYATSEKRRVEKTVETGRELYMEIRAMKRKQAEHDLALNIRVDLKNIEDAEVSINKVPARIEKGDVKISIDAWELTEYQWRWEQTPWYVFLKSLYDKFIKKVTGKYHGELISDAHYIGENIKAYLELHKYMVKPRNP